MARSANLDPLLSHKFALRELSVSTVPFGGAILDANVFSQKGKGKSTVGFQSISMTDMGLEAKEITEGNWPFTHKVIMTKASIGDITIVKAVFAASSDLYIWASQALWGRGSPRRNLAIDYLGGLDGGVTRSLLLYNCIPVSYKPGSDFDATNAEVSLEEMTLHVERFVVDIRKPPRADDLRGFAGSFASPV
jgi:phage tail-like protein